VELEPIVELGLNAEQLVDSLALLSRTFGHLLNQSGYSGADIILEDVIIPYHLVSIDCGLLGPLEAALNDQLNKLERIATTQLALAKKGAFPSPLHVSNLLYVSVLRILLCSNLIILFQRKE